MKRGKSTKLPDMPQKSSSARVSRIFLIIILLALSVRVIYFNQIKHFPFFAAPVGDEAAYHKTAQVILKGDLLAGSRIFYQDAFYPYYLAAIYAVFGEDPVVPKVFQLFLGILSCLLIYDSVRRIYGKRTAAVAGLIAAVYPVFFFFEAQLLKSSLAVLFSLVMFSALLRYEEKPGRRMLVLAGISAGFAVISQGHAYFFLPFVLWWLYARDRAAALTVRLQPLIIFLFSTMLVIAPIALRNYVVGKDLVLTTYQAGTNFYIGNHENASGIYEPLREGRELPPYEEIDAVEIAEQQSGRKLKPSEVSSFWFRKSAKFIIGKPAGYAALLGKKALLFMNYEEVPDVVDYDFMRDRSFLFRIPFLNFGVLFSFAVAGIFLGWQGKDRKTVLLYYCTLASAIAVILFYIFSRYRLQAVPFVIMLAAAAGVRIADALQKRETRTVVAALCVCVPLFVLTARDMKLVAPGLGYGLMGHMAMEKGDFTIALKCYTEVARKNPNNLALQESMRLNIAKCCMALHDYDRALEAYQRVLELEKMKKAGSDADLLYDVNANLGLIYHKRKQYDRARAILEELRRQYPDRLPARTTLATVYKKMKLYDLAIPEFLFVITREPRNIVALNNLANIYRDTGQADSARQYYRKCLALDPDNPVVLKNMQRLDGRQPDATEE